ncbi:MAG: M48 family metallopeptidase [Bifidobacteriaceae bacterium]|jgi:predicted metal-dependent hydrolase|nr:M48 family metallopeptidase [Bifidobacteriaceae bacterium]
MDIRDGDGRAGRTPSAAGVPVIVRRSPRRRKTVSAHREGEALVVSIPAAFTTRQEREWVATMTQRLMAREARGRLDDEALARRARRLSEKYLGGQARPVSVTWASNQRTRWGSATKADRTIRLSMRLAEAPGWVVDYVLLHELIHLVVPHGHGPQFRAALARYPHADMAEGFLRGLAWAQSPGVRSDQDAPDPQALF